MYTISLLVASLCGTNHMIMPRNRIHKVPSTFVFHEMFVVCSVSRPIERNCQQIVVPRMSSSSGRMAHLLYRVVLNFHSK